ncbi:MAG: Rid family detoxifying hydrolase [Myxococcota bacterium]
MSRREVRTQDAPEAIGSYAQAVQHGNLLFCSGQIPIDPETGLLVEGGVQQQTDRVMKNLSAVLKAAGAGFDSVLKTTIYLKSMEDFPLVDEVYSSYFAGAPTFPARACVEVSALPRGVDVEVELVAAVVDR